MNIKIKGNQKQKFYLPDEYTQLNYIESTGTQYIDTGYKANQKTEYEVEFSYSEMISSSNGFILGSRISSNSENISLTCDSGTIYIGRGNKYTGATATTNVNQTYSIKVTENNTTRDGTIISQIANEFGNSSGSNNVYLFTCNQNGSNVRYFKGKIYSCKIWDNGESVREFIPCKRNSDNLVGMYDTVNNVFYPNAGSGSFTAGQEQKVSPDYIAPIETVGSNINFFNKDDMDVIEGAFINSSTKKIETNVNRKCFYLKISPNKTYTISREKIASNFVVGTTAETPIIGSDIIDVDFNNNEIITITASSNANYLVCYYKTNASDVENEIVEKIKIEPGNKATAYSPYNMGSVEIDVSNKQLFNIRDLVKGMGALNLDEEDFVTVTVDNSSGTSTKYYNVYTNPSKLIKPNTKYYLIMEIKKVSGTGNIFNHSTNETDHKPQFSGSKGYNFTNLIVGDIKIDEITSLEDLTNSNSMLRTFLSFNEGQSGSITFRLSVLEEEPDSDTFEYVSYQKETKTMYTQQEMLEDDYIDNTEHHTWGKVILTGNETNWIWNPNSLARVSLPVKGSNPLATRGIIYSNYYIYPGTTQSHNVNIGFMFSESLYLYYHEGINSLTDWKNYLQEKYNSGNPVTVYYKLATPIDLELTEEQKEAQKTQYYTYEDKTYIYNDSIAILEINYGSENVPLGNYIIPKPDSEEAKEKTNFIGYDYMIKFNNLYQDRVTYPISVGDYFEDLCDQVGLEAGNIDFVNSDYMILGNPFTNNEDCRTVLSNIAQLAGGFARIGRDNKVYIISLSKDINETIDGNNYFTDFSKNNKWGEVNSLVLRISGTEGENTVIQDEESIEENGLTEIVIEDNYFLIDQTEREKVITPLWNSLKGLNYLPISTEYYGYPYLDSGDGINILDTTDTEYSTYIFNHTFKFNGGFDGQINTLAMTKTQTAYKNTIDSKTRFRQVERKIDKVNGVIEDVIEEQTDFSNKLTQVEQTVDEISQKVEDIEDVTQTIEGTKTITLTNCVEGDLLELNIYGNNTVFDYLYPSNSLYPSDTLYPYGDSRLVVADENGNSITYELGVTEVLRRNGDICDEYVLKDGQAKVIRRIYGNGIIMPTEEIEELGEFSIRLASGTNTITIKNYTGQLLAKYAIQNEYTNVFATKVEMQSSIEMNNEQINIELSKKTDNDKIIASINMSTEKEEDGSQLQLQADKISLNGVVTANSNFKINIDGSMEAKNGKFSGRIQNGEHPGSSIDGGTVITESGTIMCTDITVYASENNGGLLIIPNDFDEYFPNIQASYTNSQITFLNHENHEFPITIGLFTNTKTGHISLPNGLINVENGTIQTQNINATGYGYFESYVRASEFVQPSSEKIKENIYKLKSKSKNKKIINSAIDILKNADICEYNYKDKNKTSIGLVIGEEYNTPDEVLSEDKKGIDLYSMVSLSWKAIQELLEIINKQGQEIQELKERTNTLEDIIKNSKNT